MKKLLKFALSRSFLFSVMIVLQLGLFLWLTLQFSRFGSVAYLGITVGGVLLALAILERTDTNPSYKIMWMLIILLMPLSGLLFYFVWGKRIIKPKSARALLEIEHRAAGAIQPDKAAACAMAAAHPNLRPVSDYLSTHAAAPVYTATKCAYYPMGQNFFESFLQELQKARRFIFLEYFIIQEGRMWNETLKILKQKAAQGVDVRVIFDGIGSLFTLPSDYEETLRRCGIKCFRFNPVHFSLHISDYKMLNHRDHRKIAVIDGEVGFTGGLNFADEYINVRRRFGVWKDTALMLKGPAVYSLTTTFLKAWSFACGEETQFRQYLPQTHYPHETNFVQPYDDSPIDDENVSESVYSALIQRARHYVYITTPYLIIDNEMASSLCLAAKSGIDVRIITPGIPDKWYVYYVTQSYYARLMRAGVRIYEYTPGFIHAKMYVSDDEAAIVGSANMDYRSLYLHFENCCIFYGGDMVKEVKRDFLATMRESREVSKSDSQHVPLYKWIAQIFLRFFAPLM